MLNVSNVLSSSRAYLNSSEYIRDTPRYDSSIIAMQSTFDAAETRKINAALSFF